MHPFARWLAAIVPGLLSVTLLATATVAQSLDLSSNRMVIGAPLEGRYDIPDVENGPSYGIAIRRRGDEDHQWRGNISGTGRGTLTLNTPNLPGNYEAVLYDSTGRDHAVVPFATLVTPTPGALRPDKTSYLVGETIRVQFTKQENRYYGNGWIGLFRQGDHAAGGASMADGRMTYVRFPPPGEAATFTAPNTPGTYEIRLFDRDRWFYILDRVAVTVTVPPTPGVMTLDKPVFTIGEPITLATSLTKGRFYGNAWIGLFKAGRDEAGQSGINRDRLTYQRVNVDTETLTFTAPRDPGEYVFRLYDRDDWRYGLDELRFEVIVPPTPGVMTLDKETYTIGEPVTVKTTLQKGRHYGNAWIGLFRRNLDAPGGAIDGRYRLTYQRVKTDTEQLVFTAPPDPGDYEFILYDRDAYHYKLDATSFKVEVPPTPGVMTLDTNTFTVGTPVTLKVDLVEGRHYGNAWIGMFRKARQVAGGATVEASRITYQRVKTDTEQLVFTAPGTPGDYEFRLYDRDARRYLLDRIDFAVDVPPTPGVMALDKNRYVIGEAMTMTVDMKEGRHYGNSYIGLWRDRETTPTGAGIEHRRISYQRANLQTETLSWTAPSDPGRYVFHLYDRDAGYYRIDQLTFDVVATPDSGLLSVQKSQYQPGELVRVRVRMPENRHLGEPWVELARSGSSTNGGALHAEHKARSFRVNADTPALAFEAPQQPGPYELRFYDRGAPHFILEIKTFTVADNPAHGIEQTPVRFTPMPGGDAVAMRPPDRPSEAGPESGNGGGGDNAGGGEADGLPGQPVRPDGTPVATPNTGDGDEPDSGGDAAPDQPATAEDGPTGKPQLKFVAVGANGLVDIASIKRGQPFIVEARYATPPNQDSVTAQLSYGDAASQAIVLTKAGDAGVYRSGVIRLPAGSTPVTPNGQEDNR